MLSLPPVRTVVTYVETEKQLEDSKILRRNNSCAEEVLFFQVFLFFIQRFVEIRAIIVNNRGSGRKVDA